MEIFIYQADKQLGPFSDVQVRQYLGAGMVSPDDLAIYEGMETWQPLDAVLASLQPPTDELGAILPDRPPTPLLNSEPPAPRPEQTLNMHTNSRETLEPTSTRTSSLESLLPLTASQKTKRKQNKIVIQPIQPLAPTSPLPVVQPRKKLRTGKTAVSIEPPRPTTALPPVSSFAGKEKKTGRTVLRTGPLPQRDAPQPAAAPLSPPTTGVDTSPAKSPALKDSQPLLPPVALLPQKTRDLTETDNGWRVSPALILAGTGAALLLVGVTIASAYFVFAHFRHTALAIPVNLTPQATPAQAQAVPPSRVATPQSAAEYSDRGFDRQNKGDLTGALSDYDTALSLDPKNAIASFRRGLALETKGDWNGALADYNTVLGLDPKNADAYSNRGFVKQSLGDLDGALADYAIALQINPKISKAYYNEGLIDVQKGALDSAIAAFDQCLNLDPQMPQAFYNRAEAKMAEGNLDGAIADFTQTLAINPKIARAYSDRGLVRQTKGDLDGALADYSQALTLDPTLSVAFFKRGTIEMQRGDLEAVIADSSQAITLDPKNGAAYFNRALALIGKAHFDDAASDLNQFLSLAPRDSSADTARIYLWLIGTAQNPQGDADQKLSTALLNNWNSTPEDFTSKVASFLLGHIKERELVADAASPDANVEPAQYCKAWYFAGMKRLLNGDMTIAIKYFQKSLATNQRSLPESIFAQSELQALGQNREVASKPNPGQ
jgi:tetratricopeptide (TPR) repeat protein